VPGTSGARVGGDEPHPRKSSSRWPQGRQALTAPLVVGLLEEIRHATYARAARVDAGVEPAWHPVLMALDEAANIAPIPDLPAIVSEGGGQGLHLLACFQDLSQVRGRWGAEIAEGFLSLFQTKVVLANIADSRTLEAISVTLGEYDRVLASYSEGQSSSPHSWFPTYSSGTTYSTHRQRVLSPGEVANLPPGRALLLRGVAWSLLELTPYYQTNPWPAVLASATRAALPEPADATTGNGERT